MDDSAVWNKILGQMRHLFWIVPVHLMSKINIITEGGGDVLHSYTPSLSKRVNVCLCEWEDEHT